MELRSLEHKGLKRLYENDDALKVSVAIADKPLLMLAFLQDMDGIDELLDPPKWKAHRLGGDRKGTWSLFVTRNWRLTFREEGVDALVELNLEDYH